MLKEEIFETPKEISRTILKNSLNNPHEELPPLINQHLEGIIDGYVLHLKFRYKKICSNSKVFITVSKVTIVDAYINTRNLFFKAYISYYHVILKCMLLFFFVLGVPSGVLPVWIFSWVKSNYSRWQDKSLCPTYMLRLKLKHILVLHCTIGLFRDRGRILI